MPHNKKMDLSREDLRKHNRGRLLKLIATGMSLSRSDLAANMGLTKTAITHIANEMIELGYVEEAGKEESSRPGRKNIGLDISEKAPKSVGLLIMRDYIRAVLCDMKLNILKDVSVYREWADKEELTGEILSAVRKVLPDGTRLGGIGVASIGPIDTKEGVIKKPLFFHGIQDVHVGELLEEEFEVPVFCDNDNQSAALAEHLFGNARGYEDVLMVGMGRGVGSGIIIHGERFSGHDGYAPEIGHVSIDKDGPMCTCGRRGCLETYVNSTTNMRNMRDASGRELKFKEYCRLSSELPPLNAVFLDIAEKLSVGILNLVNLLNPEVVILGHGAVDCPDRYFKLLEDNIHERKFSNKDKRTLVLKPFFGKDAHVLGGACNVISRYFNGELL